ncbi:MAG TPA: ATP-dependent RecD-like DNA helicase, partial [Desulfobacteraceae bacterium]|nr:ATP-dependent RecD-like DNA helicase [Desulfobacteraceae bacterium]
MIVNLEGHIESVTYADEETGFTIAKVRVSGQKQYVTVVGHLLPPSPGEILKMRGEWIIHPRFGKQFKIQQYETSVPASIYGIQKYLGSGLIKGIGPVMAGRLVKKFGKRTLEVIENESEKLAEVEGIGIKRIEFITKAWKDQKDIRNVMLFLQSHDVSIAHAVKIFRQYGNRSLELLRNNPYRLATDIHGIGFATADGIAEKLGFAKDSELRAGAGILYVLNQLADQGHVYYPYGSLLDRSHDILDIDRSVLIKAFSNIELEKRIVIEDLNIGIDGFQENNKAVYLKRFHISEVTTERFMKKLANTPKSITGIDSGEAIEWVQKQLSITLAENQVEAVRCALENKIMVITGGPGTGKTTII